ncbi:MAG: hypothetical protein QM767_24735 [Anaeromyxobacter sp.]
MAALLVATACGGGGGGGGGGSQTCNPGTRTTFTIDSTGVSPKAACVKPGGTVHFENEDSVAHGIASDDCAVLDVANLDSMTSTEVSPPSVAVCTFHDATDPTNTAFQGTLAVTNGQVTGGGY